MEKSSCSGKKSGEASCYVRLEQTLEVPCNHELQVIGRVSPNWPLDTRDKGLIEVADDFDKKSGLIIPRTLVKVEDWQVMVTLSNFNDHLMTPLVLRKVPLWVHWHQ